MTEAEPALPPEDATVGARLRAARVAAGLDVADVAGRTRVNARHLRAIEAGDFASLPAPPYSVGFVKAYAREVGLDGAALSADFRRERDGAVLDYQADPQRFEPSQPGRLPGRMLAWTAAIIALLILVGYGAWRTGTLTGQGAGDRARVAAAADRSNVATTPAPAPRPAPPPPAAGPPAVKLVTTEPAWVKVYERDGETLFQGELAPGREYQVPTSARDPLIRLGRAEVMQVTVGGRYVPPLGPPARTVKDVSLKPDALLALPGKPQQLMPQVMM